MFYLGISLQKDRFNVAVIKKESGSPLIESVHSFSYAADAVKLFYNLPPFATKRTLSITSGLDSQDLFIRKLSLPLHKKSQILQALPFQLESQLPLAEKDALICLQLTPVTPQTTSVTLLAATEEKVKEHLERFAPLERKPDRVSCTPAALFRFCRHYFPHEPKVLCLHAEEGHLTCTLVEQQEILLSQSLALEGDPLLLEKLFFFLKQKGVADEQTPWLLTGESALEEKIKTLSSSKPLIIENPEHRKAATAIGFALDDYIGDEMSIQFCQHHLTSTHVLSKRKKQLLSYSACCLGAALLFAMGSFALLQRKEAHLVEELKNHYSALPKNASLQHVQEALVSWEKSLQGKSSSFALVPNVPRVSDVLAYLSAHPYLVTEEGEQREGAEIQSFHYSLTRYPKIGETSAPYSAQVDLELTCNTPRIVRDLHESLLKGDAFVNAKKEIKWQTNKNTTQISFELNKGALP